MQAIIIKRYTHEGKHRRLLSYFQNLLDTQPRGATSGLTVSARISRGNKRMTGQACSELRRELRLGAKMYL
jgi:hypothetical protein